MSKARQKVQTTMLEAWRPPRGAGDAIGCLATTFPFDAGFFEEECLARFLEIDSLPDREGLAYLLERENRLGPAFAAVLVDHRHAGVDHSLRWDVLSVRIPRGKQHAKVSLLAWTNHVRIIVASANLTPHGYRSNFEVAGIVDLRPSESDRDLLTDTSSLLRRLVGYVQGPGNDPIKQRTLKFLDQVQMIVSQWIAVSKRDLRVSVSLTATLPSGVDGAESRSSLNECLAFCRKHGGSPAEVQIASPFFDSMSADGADETTAQLCKGMARGVKRTITFCVPPIGESDNSVRLAAPISLWKTAERSRIDRLAVATLPLQDTDHNLRPWHAKMLSLSAPSYVALMMGSSNFTKAGLGVGGARNAEANLMYLAKREAFGRETGMIAACWPDVTVIEAPLEAEWEGPQQDEEETTAFNSAVPACFVSVFYRFAESPVLVLTLVPSELHADWSICGGSGGDQMLILDATTYAAQGCASEVEVPWQFSYAPGKLLVSWGSETAFWTVNAGDQSQLPAPQQIEDMSFEDLLNILSASDSSAAFRVWATEMDAESTFDEDLDSAVPPDLDALRRYRLDETFLHRVRYQARKLAAVKTSLERPVWSEQALRWRLTGIIGVERLVDRMAADLGRPEYDNSEIVLNLADLLMVLHDVEYQSSETALNIDAFTSVYRTFLQEITSRLNDRVNSVHGLSREVRHFWSRVCQRKSL